MIVRRWTLGIAAGAAVAALTGATPLTAAPDTGKVVVRIDVKGEPQGGNPSGGGGTFTMRVGAAADKGTDYYSFSGSAGNITLTGKHGELVVRTKSRPSGLHVDSEGLDIWTGTWSILSGTGSYAGAHGVGAYVGIIGPSHKVALHLEGFRT